MLSNRSLPSLLLLVVWAHCQDLQTMEDQWTHYRRLVSDGGFLYNDSFIVVNDYDQTTVETNIDTDSDTNVGDVPQLGFENTLMGMVSALQDIQTKGDQMMSAISDQKKVLSKLRSEVAKAEERLEEAVKVTAEIEMKRSEAEKEIKTAERNTRMLSRRKTEIKQEVETLQEKKEASLIKLEELRTELKEVNEEMKEVSLLRSNLTPLEKSLESRQNELNNLEASLQSKTSELTKVKQQITTSSKILDGIKVRLAESPEPAADKLAQQTPSPYLVPALVVSVLLNLVTGGAIVTNYIAPTTDREDSELYQFVGDSLYGEVMGRSEPLVPDNDKMDRDEGILKYIEQDTDDSQDINFADLFVDGDEVYYDLPRYFNY